VIVGAGPYGLSLAAHLRARGVDFRIFGKPMYSWQMQMPQGMLLKSEGFASCIDEPEREFSLARFCEQRGLAYQDIGLPVPVETFVDYGLAFQKRFVPDLERRHITNLGRNESGFELQLDDGQTITASQVVVAVGIGHFPHVPDELKPLGVVHLSHSSQHADLGAFCGRRVIVVGAGASAVDLAALLHRAGSSVRLVARRGRIDFHAPPGPGPRRISDRLRRPRSGLGLGWRSRLCEDAPLLFHMMPRGFRVRTVRQHLGPAAGWFVREQVERCVPLFLGRQIVESGASTSGVWLRIAAANGDKDILEADHVIAATGYRVDLRRLGFLTHSTLDQLRMVGHTPALSSCFETSLPGLFFIGPAAANCFGPLLRFACGTRFASRRLAPYIAGRVGR
jgi:thioredoxin reductase